MCCKCVDNSVDKDKNILIEHMYIYFLRYLDILQNYILRFIVKMSIMNFHYMPIGIFTFFTN